MDGYQYEANVLWPRWKSDMMKERLDELGLEIKKDPIEIQMNLSSKIVRNPDNFYPELSPDYELMKSTRKSKWG